MQYVYNYVYSCIRKDIMYMLFPTGNRINIFFNVHSVGSLPTVWQTDGFHEAGRCYGAAFLLSGTDLGRRINVKR